ncbi:MAG: thioesterase family protein [Desulfuromonadaceae bacterium]|nr:thioesterase family protein [Desulfuromonadaceae bacterium]MDD2855469.1 thioesterase family protein [Desulfuromonadaceae bacterium]
MDSPLSVTRRSQEEQVRLEIMFTDIFEHRFSFNEVIGFKVGPFEPGSPRLRFDMKQDLIGSYIHNRLHGGVIATALDTIGGFAVVLAISEKYANETAEQIITRFGRFGTIDLRVDYLHQGVGRNFEASAKVIRLGGRIASVQMELRNDSDLLIAVGTAAYIIS